MQGPGPVPADCQSGVGVRRPGDAVRHHHQPWHTAPITGPDQRQQSLHPNTCISTTPPAIWPSLNLLTFLEDDGSFDVDGFKAATEVIFTAQEILVGNADYPTEKIGDNSRRFRQLGIGYANLGALLMAQGLPYDSDEGRAWAAAITALLTGSRLRHLGPHRGAHGSVRRLTPRTARPCSTCCACTATRSPTSTRSWCRPTCCRPPRSRGTTAVELGRAVRRAQLPGQCLAPTGCLVGGSLVATDRGLVRLRSLGDPDGDQWQDLDIDVATDDGPARATQVLRQRRGSRRHGGHGRGYRIQGTPTHRVKVVDRRPASGHWRRFAEIARGRPGAAGARPADRRATGGPAAAAARGVLDRRAPRHGDPHHDPGSGRARRLLHGRRVAAQPRPAVLCGRRRTSTSSSG